MKKRMKGKMYGLKKKQSKKRPLKAKESQESSPGQWVESKPGVEDTVRGNCVDYHCYLLLFSLTRNPLIYDSIVVEYTGQHRKMTEASQSRLNHMMDTIPPERVRKVYIQNYSAGKQGDLHYTRTRPIRRFLRGRGIPRSRIYTATPSADRQKN